MKSLFLKISRPRRIRFIFWLTTALLLSFAFLPRGYAQSPEAATEPLPQTFPYTKTFVISSYYSPLPNQKYFVTGSFEGDVRLNGEGIHAADGTIVYPGMVAAPVNFPFGTKMEIPGFGIVAVHDRGGAIKRNRLDIWVGSGEEGLARALGWGLRTVSVTVFGIDSSIVEFVNFQQIPLADLSRIPVQTKFFQADLALDDTGQEVGELQRFLKVLGYFGGKSDPPFVYGEETQEAVKKFQLEFNVIPNEADTGAGNFGPRSRAELERVLSEKKSEKLAKLPSPGIRKNEYSEVVNNLQEILQFYNYLPQPTRTFDVATSDALLRFQLDLELVKSPRDFGAGFYGLKTQTALRRLIEDSFTPDTKLAVRKKSDEVVASPIFIKNIKKGDQGAEVAALQEELFRLHFLGLAPTGYFGNTTEHAVIKFQENFGIITSELRDGAGVVGPKTLEKLNSFIAIRRNSMELIAKTTSQKELVAERIHDESTLIAGIAANTLFPDNLTYGVRSREVNRLQTVLKRLGFFPGRLTTEYFGDITQASVLAFQKSHGLEASGHFDDETRRIMNKIVISAPQAS